MNFLYSFTHAVRSTHMITISAFLVAIVKLALDVVQLDRAAMNLTG